MTSFFSELLPEVTELVPEELLPDPTSKPRILEREPLHLYPTAPPVYTHEPANEAVNLLEDCNFKKSLEVSGHSSLPPRELRQYVYNKLVVCEKQKISNFRKVRAGIVVGVLVLIGTFVANGVGEFVLGSKLETLEGTNLTILNVELESNQLIQTIQFGWAVVVNLGNTVVTLCVTAFFLRHYRKTLLRHSVNVLKSVLRELNTLTIDKLSNSQVELVKWVVHMCEETVDISVGRKTDGKGLSFKQKLRLDQSGENV